MQFKSHQSIEDNAEAELKTEFDAHTCQHEDASQAAARIMREATDDK